VTRPKTSLAYTVMEAAIATSTDHARIRDAIKLGDLVAHWVGNKQIIRAEDLDEWIQTLPTERAS